MPLIFLLSDPEWGCFLTTAASKAAEACCQRFHEGDVLGARASIARMEWHAVRCVFRHWMVGSRDQTYEERVTLWHAESASAAIELAETEAAEYCDALDSEQRRSEYTGLAQSYWLDDTPAHGAEVFSLMRDSPLDPAAYITRFFADGSERLQDLGQN